jgi:hypothetical protein
VVHKARSHSTPNYGKWWRCEECAKRTFADKAAAKRAIREMRRDGEPVMHHYAACSGNGRHVGHIPENVRRGYVTRADVYGAAA